MTSPLPPAPATAQAMPPASLDTTAWTESVLDHLSGVDQDGASAVSFIRTNRVKLGFRKQNATGAMWSLDGNIYLNSNSFSPATPPTDAFMLNLVAHEALHLKQGLITALSVRGELEAWQLGFRIYQILGGKIFSSALNELMSLPLSYNRDMLIKVRFLMKEYAGKGYRIDLLPRYPLPKEIAYFFTRKIPV
jgi:hypothetical protein